MPQVWQDRLVRAALQPISIDTPGKGSDFNLHTVSPSEESGNDLQHLKFLGIRSLESEEMDKMISDELPNGGQRALGWLRIRKMARCSLLVNIFIRLALLQISKGFRKMVI